MIARAVPLLLLLLAPLAARAGAFETKTSQEPLPAEEVMRASVIGRGNVHWSFAVESAYSDQLYDDDEELRTAPGNLTSGRLKIDVRYGFTRSLELGLNLRYVNHHYRLDNRGGALPDYLPGLKLDPETTETSWVNHGFEDTRFYLRWLLLGHEENYSVYTELAFNLPTGSTDTDRSIPFPFHLGLGGFGFGPALGGRVSIAETVRLHLDARYLIYHIDDGFLRYAATPNYLLTELAPDLQVGDAAKVRLGNEIQARAGILVHVYEEWSAGVIAAYLHKAASEWRNKFISNDPPGADGVIPTVEVWDEIPASESWRLDVQPQIYYDSGDWWTWHLSGTLPLAGKNTDVFFPVRTNDYRAGLALEVQY